MHLALRTNEKEKVLTFSTANLHDTRYKTAESAILVLSNYVFMHINGHDSSLLGHKTCIPESCAGAALGRTENVIINAKMYSTCVEKR